MSTPLRILIVEDSEDDVLLLQRALQRGGCDLTFQRVDTAAAMNVALEREKWDVIISDYNLPQFSGLAALELLKAKELDLPFIIVSGEIGEEVAVKAMKAGAHDYVMKDNLARLAPAIERELREAIVRQERRRAEEELLQSEAHYRNLFEELPIALYEEDYSVVKTYLEKLRQNGVSDFRTYLSENPKAVNECARMVQVVNVNQAAVEINKVSSKEQLLTTLDKFFIDETYENFREELISLAEGKKLVLSEVTCRTVGEETKISSVNRISILPGYEDTWTKVLVSAVDITERKQAEEEIRRRNRELVLFNRIIAASVTSLDPEEILESACRELAQAFEVPQVAATLLNQEKTVAVIVAEQTAEGQPSALGQSWSVLEDPSYQYLLTHKAPLVIDDSSTDPRLVSVQDMLHRRGITSMVLLPLISQNQVIGNLGLGDLKPRSFSNEEVSLAWSVADQVAGALDRAQLDKERRQLSAAIEQTAESVIITDTDSTILYVNPAFEQVSGYKRSEVIGQTPRILRSSKQNSAFYRTLWATISAGKVWQGRFINRKKDGSHYTEDATITPVRDESGDVVNYVSVQRDVTHELQLEEQYRQAQKMEAVGRLAAGIAHDFNNLLTAINGFATLIQNELSSGDPLQELVDKILHSGQRAAELVRQLLAFSRKQVVKPQILNLNTVVSNLDKMLQRIIGEHIELEAILAPDLWSVRADASQMEQIIVNLAVNASDAMPDGGRLIIETANVILDDAFVADHLDVQPGEHVLLTVCDTGIGMSREVMEHIFEPFFTTKEVGKGTGLGLATVFGIVKQSGGHIWVNTDIGQGSTFKIYLPRVTETVAPSFMSGLNVSLPRGMETILLVEDELIVRELATRVLRQQGYTVLEVANGEEALQKARDYGEEIHLLLTDVIMPQMDGQALAENLRLTRPRIKVLFTSGYTHNSISRRGVLEADVLFIQKPFSPADLSQKVRNVLDDSQRIGGQ